MKTSSLHSYFIVGLLLFVTKQTYTQTNRAFAITGETKGNVAWNAIREIDLTTGSEIRKIYSPADKPAIIDALTGKRLEQLDMKGNLQEVTIINHTGISNTMVTYTDGRHAEVVTAPTETFVAASAYDSKNNRLFFTPMRSNELRYFDLNAGANTVYYIRNAALKAFAETNGEADVITRMCFAADGYGYALTNDANHLIRFSSGDKVTITDLGGVQDGKNNKDISIRNLCTSWGGDMVADAFGNLYSISMRGNVFKINPQTLVADYFGTIKNIPTDYTINGAAVNAQGNIVLSCASKIDYYYTVDLANLEAVALAKQKENVYNASDLASSHLLYESQANSKLTASSVNGNSLITIYPNPVINRTLNVSFNQFTGSDYNIQLVDVGGHNILSKMVNVNGKTTTQIILPASVASGMYIVKVIDQSGKEQYSGKIVVY